MTYFECEPDETCGVANEPQNWPEMQAMVDQLHKWPGGAPNEAWTALSAIIKCVRDEVRRKADVANHEAMLIDDGMCFRWLTEDHADRTTRERCRSLIGRMSVMSYSATKADVIVAMRETSVPYPTFCIHPDKCAGLSCCPRPYSCAE